jgi:oligosaccharide repeat unit polymerase
MRVEGEIQGILPYIFIISFVGVFFSGIYTAYKNKITLVALLPLIAVLLKEVANISRAGMLFGFFLFFISFLLTRHLLLKTQYRSRLMNKTSLAIAGFVVVILVLFSAVTVKTFRNPVDKFQASSRELNKLEGSAVVSPSIYLYSCSHIGVLNEYLEDEKELTHFGENTFLPIYNFIAKFNFVEHPSFFQRGYFIPVWTNTGTYLREIHADFGNLGVLIIPYLLGLITSFFWFRLYESGKLINLLILTYLYLIIAFSFVVMVTRLSSWFISFVILLIVLPAVQNYSLKFKKTLL